LGPDLLIHAASGPQGYRILKKVPGARQMVRNLGDGANGKRGQN
jgi:hypothetical protein